MDSLGVGDPQRYSRRGGEISEMTKQSQTLKKTIIGKMYMKTSYDDLGLRDPASRAYRKITGIIRNKSQPTEADMVFSDYMYKTDASLNKRRVIMLVTDQNLWVMRVEDYALVNRVSLTQLRSVVLVTTNSSVFALNFGNETSSFALFLESVRRTEFVLFLLSTCETDKTRTKMPEICRYLKLQLLSQNEKSANKVVSFDKESNQGGNQGANPRTGPTDLIQNLGTGDYLLSTKYGYVNKRSKSWRKNWAEKFLVLTNIGLIYMDKPTDRTVKVFPFLDYEVVELDEAEYGRRFVFQLRTAKGGAGSDFVVQAWTKKDYSEWIKALNDLRLKVEVATQ